MSELNLIEMHPFAVAPESILAFRHDVCVSGPADSRVMKAKHHTRSTSERLEKAFHDPIKLLASGSGCLIIDGHRRMAAAFEAGFTTIPALVYPEDTPTDVILHLILTAAIASQNLSGVEIATLAYKAARFAQGTPCREALPLEKIGTDTVPKHLLPYMSTLVGRNISSEFLLRCFQILTLSPEELSLLHRQHAPLENMLTLLDLGFEERLLLLKLKEATTLTTSQIRLLTRLLIFARARSGFDLNHWFEARQKTQTSSQHGADLIRSLRRELYPELTKREKNIAAHVKTMKLPTSIRINTPENLEGNEFSCYFTFSTVEELEHALDLFQDALAAGTIQAILDELNEP